MRGMEVNNSNNNSNNNNLIIAPFVMKTYQMVNDPATNRLITWGKENNSFIVLEPLEFSQRILPGFKKVDPDKWEFANEWFLRGQTQLLPNIVRKKHTSKTYNTSHHLIKHEDEEDDELITEIAKLKQEQQSLEQELENMNRRLEATERRPQQMMTFLCKVVEDPEILPRMILEKENLRRLTSCNGNNNSSDKKRKLVVSTDSSNSLSGMAMTSSSSIKSEDEPISSSDGNLDVDAYCQSSPTVEIESPPEWWSRRGRDSGVPVMIARQGNSSFVNMSSLSLVGSERDSGGSMAVAPVSDGGFDTSNFEGFTVAGEGASPPLPYPFSLFGGGF